jgi:hypothetical protein
MVHVSEAVEGSRPGKPMAAVASALALALGGCGSTVKEVAIQNARAGDLLVEAAGTRVELVRPFKSGVANGQYKGVVKVSSSSDGSTPQLHEMSAVCSIKDAPGWPRYDNIYGHPIKDVNAEVSFAAKDRWQILYHFDGRIEKKGSLQPNGWTSRLKDNLCRKGDFDDTGKVATPTP